MSFDEFIEGVVRRTGLSEKPVPAADGSVMLRFADVDMSLAPTYDGEVLLVEAKVCPVPKRGVAAFMRKLLRDNHAERLVAGGAFALDDEDVIRHRHLFVLEYIDDRMFVDGLPDYLNRIQRWREASVEGEAAYLPASVRAEMASGSKGPPEGRTDLPGTFQEFRFIRV